MRKGTKLDSVTSTAAAKKCLITKRDMHIYTGNSTVQLEPVQTRIHTKIYYVIRYTTSFFEKAGLLVQFNNNPAGVLFAADNDEKVAGRQLVFLPGGGSHFCLCSFMTMNWGWLLYYFLFRYLKVITVIKELQ